MKKSVGLVLLILLFFQLGGSYVYFMIRMVVRHAEMREQLSTLPSDQLTLLIFSESDYEQTIVDDREVKADGKMYDVARIEKKGGKILVYALQDEAEDNLLSFVYSIFENDSGDEKQIPNQVYQFITLSFLAPINTFAQPSFDFLSKGSTPYFVNESSFISSINSPPPKA